MGYNLSTFESADRLHSVSWDRLLSPTDAMQTVSWLTVQEKFSPTPLQYHVLRDGDAPVAGLVSVLADERVPWTLARPDEQLRSAREQGLLDVDIDFASMEPDDLLPALVCGGRHIGRTRPVGKYASVDELAIVLDAAVGRARAEGLRWITFPHVDTRDRSLIQLLQRRGFSSFVSGTACWIDVPPDGLDGYLARMSQSKRRRIRRDRKEVAAAGFTVSVEPLTSALAPRLGELDAALLGKYGNPFDAEESAALIEQLATALPDRLLVSVARRQNKIAGFGILLRHCVDGEEQWHGYRAGFDYQEQGSVPLYFDVLYYAVLEAAAERGVSTVNVGIGSTDAKVAHGCESSVQRCYVKELS